MIKKQIKEIKDKGYTLIPNVITGSECKKYKNILEESYKKYSKHYVSFNKNRTVSDVRHAFTKFSGNLGADGSVAYMFDLIGLLFFTAIQDEDSIMEAAIDGGADDIKSMTDDSFEVITSPNNFENLIEYMGKKGFKPSESEITMRCSTDANLNQKEAETMIKLVDALEELDDVQTVHTNAEISDEIIENL